MALVPIGTVAERNRQVEGFAGLRDVLVRPPDQRLPVHLVNDTLMQPRLQMAVSNTPGVMFTLLFVIVITNIHNNSFGYLSISLLLPAVWLLTFFLYDRRYYMVFGSQASSERIWRSA